MKKNVIWWPAIVNPNHKDKYGGYGYFEYSRKAWEYWCKENDCILVEFTEPFEKDLSRIKTYDEFLHKCNRRLEIASSYLKED